MKTALSKKLISEIVGRINGQKLHSRVQKSGESLGEFAFTYRH